MNSKGIHRKCIRIVWKLCQRQRVADFYWNGLARDYGADGDRRYGTLSENRVIAATTFVAHKVPHRGHLGVKSRFEALKHTIGDGMEK